VIAASFAVAGVAIAVLVVVLAAATVVRRWYRGHQERRRARIVEPLRQVLIRLVTDPTGDDPSLEHQTLVATPPRTWRALEPTVLDLLRKVRGESRQRLVDLVVAQGTVERMRRRSRGVGAVRRAHAAELLGLLGQVESRDDLVRLLEDRDPEVRLVAARALGELGDPTAAEPLLQALVRERSVPLRVVARSLARLGPATAPALVGGLASRNALERAVCAEISGLLGVTAAQAALLDVMETEQDDDVRIRAARALGRIGLPSALGALVRATDSSQPVPLRAVAARALGDLGGPGPVDFLEVLLADPDHKVSTNAGQSLSRVGAAGQDRLRRLARQPGGAGDCAREALAIYAVTHGLAAEASAPLATTPPAQRSGSPVAGTSSGGTAAEVGAQ
jgi:hypothetical protein